MKSEIYVVSHKQTRMPEGKIYYPLQVGPAKENFKGYLRDNTGDNIAARNQNYSELTAQYWAAHNRQADVKGLVHYRRLFSDGGSHFFATVDQKYKHVMNEKQLTELMDKYDMILPHLYHDHNHISEPETMSVYDIYANYHYKQDLDSAIAYIKEKYPYMQNALESSLYSKPARWHIANMFVMKKELFFAYCEWIFDVLFAIEKKIDYKQYNPYQARVFGFLAERLFNVWITYKKEQENLKIFYAPIVVFVKKKPFIGWDINSSYKRFYLFGIRVYKGKNH